LGFLPRPEGRTAKLVLPATRVAPLGTTRRESFVLRRPLNSLKARAAASVCVHLEFYRGRIDRRFWRRRNASNCVRVADNPARKCLRQGIVVGAAAAFAAVAMLLLGATSDAPGAPALGVASPRPLLMVVAMIVGTGFVRLRMPRRKAQHVRAGRYDSLAETMGCLVLCCDRSGSVSWVSSNCEALFGLRPSALTGRGFFERVQVADRPAFLRTIADTSAGSVPTDATLRWRGTARADRGDYAEPVFLWLEMRARRGFEYRAAQRDSQDDDVVAVFRDVTEAKLREAALEGARAAAEEANLDKDYFLAQAGHELRTPLNAIAGFSELLCDSRLAPPDPEKHAEYARIIYRSGRHLLAVVDSILDLSKIQSGLAIEIEPFAVAPLIDLCCDMVKLHAKNNGVELLRAYPGDLEEITGDRRVWTQILVNLLSNAVKFTPPNGSVIISAKPEAHSLLILVADTGIGIAAGDLARLGDPFFQAKATLDRQNEGTGLGLSIVRGLVGLQGGTIMVASEPGKGTSVRVRLPRDWRGLATKAGILANIETSARLPIPDQHDLYKQMTVKKIA
jgi:two-component system, cell cycle sensor histidine kinase DivJ